MRERERKRGYGGRGKPKVSKSVSRSSKTGLQFPVGRITRLISRHIQLAVRNDEELRKLLGFIFHAYVILLAFIFFVFYVLNCILKQVV